MASYENFYSGANYGLDPDYSTKIVSSGSIGLTTDARTANQLKEVAGKLSTGAKVIELTAISPEIVESIPNQHLEEINRLKKLAGAELTFHGPLIEPTGVGEKGWDENQRKQAEDQIWSAVERSHKIDPTGNVIVTLHSSNGLPTPRQTVLTEDGKEISTNLAVIDERTGRFGMLPKPTKEYLTEDGKIKEASVDDSLNKLNRENWTQALSNLNISVTRGRQAVIEALATKGKIEEEKEKAEKIDPEISKVPLDLYKLSIEDPEKYEKSMKKLNETVPLAGELMQRGVDELSHANIHARDSCVQLKELFNQAYEAAEKNKDEIAINKLDKLRKEIAPTINEYDNDPVKMRELINGISKGIRVLDSLKTAPQIFRPLEDFAVEKASDTFSNVAFNSFKKFGDTSPIISIENPPVGMGLARADELNKLVDESRKKFVDRAVKEKGLSIGEAKEQAEKLIGVTWDVGHINMLRKYGYGDKELVKETKKIAPNIKHVHLSDNFGMQHTELPMGMGNVPIKKEMEIIKKYNDKVKKIVETGNWYQHFQISPLKKTFEAFGSPIYAGTTGPTWEKTGMMGDYFAGQGMINPDIHHQVYGAGFANLPTELGGQIGGGAGGRSRFSGTPTE